MHNLGQTQYTQYRLKTDSAHHTPNTKLVVYRLDVLGMLIAQQMLMRGSDKYVQTSHLHSLACLACDYDADEGN